MNLPADHPSRNAQRLQAYRRLGALRQAARDLAATTNDGSDLDNVAALVAALVDERLAEHAGLEEWVTT